ncbi:MAG: LacI family DNA-binding transcriptional regulator [Acidobacteriaceae bacterium]|nr:LacI family DNA-binding transcriptional regulator [Acidobacteriaceae bacterium]
MTKQPSSRLSLEEVAHRAKVSTATVSRVLNNVGSVKNSTRTRVLRVAQELNYQPNIHARMLARGSSRTLGMIVSNIENPFFLDIFRAAEYDAHAQGFEMVVAHTGYEAEQLLKSLRLMIARRVAGLAMIVSETDRSLVEELSGHRIPVVLYDVTTPVDNASRVRVNYGSGIRKAVQYLYHVGHRRMAFVSHHATLPPISVREKAFRETADDFAPAVTWISRASTDGLEGGQLAARKVLASGFDPTAIVCVNDFMAFGVIRELREQGLRVPEDVSVTGFDNIKLSEYCFPPLTTLHIPRDQIGHIVADALLSGIKRGEPARDVMIEPEFVLRDSTGPARS